MVVIEANEGGAQISPVVVTGFELVWFSLTMEDPPLLRSCNSGSPPFHSDFASDMAQLTPIILGLSGAMFDDLVCRFVSLSSLGRLGRLNVLGSNASVGIDIGAAFSKLVGGEKILFTGREKASEQGPFLDMDLFSDMEPTSLR